MEVLMEINWGRRRGRAFFYFFVKIVSCLAKYPYMRPYLIVSVLICLSFSFSFGQSVSSSKQIGFSEYPGNVTGYVNDKDGNAYALVHFTGSFSPDSSVTYTGNGGDDILIIKYGPDKTIKWAKNLGTGNMEYPLSVTRYGNMLFYDSIRNELLLHAIISLSTPSNNVVFANTSTPLPPTVNALTLLVKLDSSGNERWTKTFSFQPNEIIPGNEKIDIFYSRNFTSDQPPLYIGNEAVNTPSNPKQSATSALIHASIGQDGVLQSVNQIRTLNQSGLELRNVIAAKDKFIFSIRANGDSLYLNDQKIRFTPNKFFPDYLISVDTSFEHLFSLYLPVATMFPQVYIEETNRLYCMGIFLNGGVYPIGGTQVQVNNEQILFAFDDNFVLKDFYRVAPYNINSADSIRPNNIRLAAVMRFGDSLYFTGSITGGNEFPDSNLPVSNFDARIFFHHTKTINLNGQSNIFFGHTDLNIQQPELHWIGEIESSSSTGIVPLTQLQVQRDQAIFSFVPSDSKGIKRWQYDMGQNKLISKDSMSTQDMLDPTQHIEVNTDGSYVIAGTSFGKLKIDDELGIKTRPRKAGIYFAGISSTQQTNWISRIESSYEIASLQQFERNGNKFYFYVQFAAPLNRQNFIKAGETVIHTGKLVNLSIIGFIRNNGEIVIKNNPLNENGDISTANLTEFSFDKNTGEVYTLMNLRSLPHPGFFKNKGYPVDIRDFIVKFDSVLNFKDSRGIKTVHAAGSAPLIQLQSMAGSGNKIYLSAKSLPRSPYGAISLELYNGGSLMQKVAFDTLAVNEIRLSLIRFNWDEGIKWIKKTNRTAGSTSVFLGSSQIREGELEYVNHKLYMYFKLPNQLVNASYNWDNQLVSKYIAENIPSLERMESLVCLDTLGNLQSKLSFYGAPIGRRLQVKNGTNTLIACYNFVQPFKTVENTYTSMGTYDALGLIIDSALNIKKRIHLHSTAQEILQDFDFTPDTTILLAAHIQKETNIALQRTSNSTVKEEDLQEQSVIITYRSTMITPVPDTQLSSLLLYPNPSKAGFYTDLGTSPAGAYNIVVFDMLGRAAFSKKINWVQGSPIPVQLPGTVRKGMYFVQVKTAKGKNIHATKLLIE